MGEASRRKKERRKGARGGKRTRETIEVAPTLQAFVICERVDTNQDGVHSLYRIVDRFNLRLRISGPKGATPPPQLPVPGVNYVLFARYGAGVGRYRASFELVDPDGQALQATPETHFWLRNREQSHNVITSVSMPVAKDGPYKWLARLDDKVVGEYVFATRLETTIANP